MVVAVMVVAPVSQRPAQETRRDDKNGRTNQPAGTWHEARQFPFSFCFKKAVTHSSLFSV